MKKTLMIGTLGLLVSVNAFAQGYINFIATGSPIWDDFSTANTSKKSSGNVDYAFLIGTGTSLIGNAASVVSASGNSTAAEWTAILTDPNYMFALNAASGNSLIVGTTGTGLGSGNITVGEFETTTSAGITGGSTYNVIVVAWSSAYATPSLAAAANAALGWSAPMSYATGAAANSNVNTLNQDGIAAFGVNVVTVPEPCTMALLGLGGLSLLMIRRRK
jgi:hypothetical protein